MAHCNTIFHQMLKLIPRHDFAKLETEHGTGRKPGLLPGGASWCISSPCNLRPESVCGMASPA